MSLIGASFVRLSLLATLNLQSPSLTHVNITGDSNDNIISVIVADVISAAVCGWNQLRHLSVNSLSADALQHVVVLPLLENLTLRNAVKMTARFLALLGCSSFSIVEVAQRKSE